MTGTAGLADGPELTIRMEVKVTTTSSRESNPVAAAVCRFFVERPLIRARLDHIALSSGVSEAEARDAMELLIELGLVRRDVVQSGELYLFTPADGFLSILEGVSDYYADQLDSLAISPERAHLAGVQTAGGDETSPERESLRGLRARVASLEAANTMLMRKNAELTFLSETSALIGSSIDAATVALMTLEAVAQATASKAQRYFVALSSGDGARFACGTNVDRDGAEKILAGQRRAISRCLDTGEVIAVPPHASGSAGSPADIFVIVPLPGSGRERAHGCIVIVSASAGGLDADDMRRLGMLAQIAGRGLQLSKLYSQSVDLVTTDDLTGAFNRRYLFTRLSQEMRRAHREREELSVVMLDVDFFKRVNDDHGHAEGDRALKAITNAVSASVREIDVTTRVGGEEFALILPSAGSFNAYTIAERVRHAVEQMRHRTTSGHELRLTVSCGIATMDDSTRSPGQLIAAADDQLLRAKRDGRNRSRAKTP